jgi:hypothetical protein
MYKDVQHPSYDRNRDLGWEWLSISDWCLASSSSSCPHSSHMFTLQLFNSPSLLPESPGQLGLRSEQFHPWLCSANRSESGGMWEIVWEVWDAEAWPFLNYGPTLLLSVWDTYIHLPYNNWYSQSRSKHNPHWSPLGQTDLDLLKIREHIQLGQVDVC